MLIGFACLPVATPSDRPLPPLGTHSNPSVVYQFFPDADLFSTLVPGSGRFQLTFNCLIWWVWVMGYCYGVG